MFEYTNLTDYNNVCFIIDSQGFYIRNNFWPREVVIKSNEYCICLEFDPPFITNLSRKEKKMINFVTNRIHGITWNSSKPTLPVLSFPMIMQHLYSKLSTKEKNMVLCKNKHLEDILTELWIPVRKFEEEIIYNKNLSCKFNHINLRCALNKFDSIYNVIKF